MATWNEPTAGADITLSNVDPATGRASLGAVGWADVQQFGPITLSLIGDTGMMSFRPRFAGTLVDIAGVLGLAETSGASLGHLEINGSPVTLNAALTIPSGESPGSAMFDTTVHNGGDFAANSTVSVYVTGVGLAGNISVTLGYTRTVP